jgi:hypothetical protein
MVPAMTTVSTARCNDTKCSMVLLTLSEEKSVFNHIQAEKLAKSYKTLKQGFDVQIILKDKTKNYRRLKKNDGCCIL